MKCYSIRKSMGQKLESRIKYLSASLTIFTIAFCHLNILDENFELPFLSWNEINQTVIRTTFDVTTKWIIISRKQGNYSHFSFTFTSFRMWRYVFPSSFKWLHGLPIIVNFELKLLNKIKNSININNNKLRNDFVPKWQIGNWVKVELELHLFSSGSFYFCQFLRRQGAIHKWQPPPTNTSDIRLFSFSSSNYPRMFITWGASVD